MKTLILIATGSLAVTALYGQAKVEYGGATFQFAGVTGAEGKVIGVPGIGSQIVTGKPFSATEERHSLQVLGDGTRIESSETNRLYRDDQGRTRVELAGGNISIFDPVAGFSAELIPSTKEVSRANVLVREGRVVTGSVLSPALFPAEGNNAEVLRSRLAKLREEMSQRQSQYTAQSPQIMALRAQIADLEKALATPTAAKRIYFFAPPAATGDGGLTVQSPAQQDMLKKQLMEAQAGGERTNANTAADGPVILRVGPGDNASVESLPSQMVNGALSQGTRTTETIPVGKIGNDRPISVVNERWFSSDIQMLVKSTSSDPRFGDTTYQLTNIVQAAPDPSLFQIPSDYTIRK